MEILKCFLKLPEVFDAEDRCARNQEYQVLNCNRKKKFLFKVWKGNFAKRELQKIRNNLAGKNRKSTEECGNNEIIQITEIETRCRYKKIKWRWIHEYLYLRIAMQYYHLSHSSDFKSQLKRVVYYLAGNFYATVFFSIFKKNHWRERNIWTSFEYYKLFPFTYEKIKNSNYSIRYKYIFFI